MAAEHLPVGKCCEAVSSQTQGGGSSTDCQSRLISTRADRPTTLTLIQVREGGTVTTGILKRVNHYYYNFFDGILHTCEQPPIKSKIKHFSML